jgi:hypothetical protein
MFQLIECVFTNKSVACILAVEKHRLEVEDLSQRIKELVRSVIHSEICVIVNDLIQYSEDSN